MGAGRRIQVEQQHLSRNIGLVCFSRSYGGLEMTTIRLAEQLSGRGANIHLIVPEGSPLHSECLSRHVSHTPLEPIIKYADLRVAWRLARVINHFALDTLLFFRSQDIHLGSLARSIHPRTRLIFYQQMQSGIRKKDPLHNAVFSSLSAWLTLTDIMRNEVLTWTNMPPEKVHVAYLGRDEKTFTPSAGMRKDSRKSLRIPQDAFVAGVLGRLDRQKGQIEFLQTYPAVRTSVPGVRFLIAGDETKNDPGMRNELATRANGLDKRGHIRIMPPTDDVARFMSALDVFVMPSYSETYGLVLIEAMAMGIPIISTASGGVPELVRHNKEGLLVEPKDSAGLSAALVILGRDAPLRRSLGRNGRERFLSTFREGLCVDHVATILRNIPR